MYYAKIILIIHVRGKIMTFSNDKKNQQIKDIDEHIKTLEEEKIELLREVPFKSWNRLTVALQRISDNLIIFTDLCNELSVLKRVYEDKEDIIERKGQLEEAIKEIKVRVAPIIAERDSILEDYDKEFAEKLQDTYIKIRELEKRKEDMDILKDMIRNPKGFSKEN